MVYPSFSRAELFFFFLSLGRRSLLDVLARWTMDSLRSIGRNSTLMLVSYRFLVVVLVDASAPYFCISDVVSQ